MIRTMLLVGIGGFVGTCGRFAVNRLCSLIWTAPFPIATFAVNIIGCFLFGLLSGISQKSGMLTSTQSAMLVTGFCGGFTTFSTFAGDMVTLGSKGDWGISAVYLALSVIVGIIMVWLGRLVANP